MTETERRAFLFDIMARLSKEAQTQEQMDTSDSLWKFVSWHRILEVLVEISQEPIGE